MSVRDEEQQPAQVKTSRRVPPWWDMLSQAPGVLLLGGLVIYAYLSICYARFYGSLEHRTCRQCGTVAPVPAAAGSADGG